MNILAIAQPLSHWSRSYSHNTSNHNIIGGGGEGGGRGEGSGGGGMECMFLLKPNLIASASVFLVQSVHKLDPSFNQLFYLMIP